MLTHSQASLEPLLELDRVRTIAQIVARRWSGTFEVVAGDDAAGAMAAPIRVAGETRGILVARHASASASETGALTVLVEEAARAMADALAARPVPSAARSEYHGILGQAEPMQDLYRLLDRVIKSDSTVLVTGENGTGKELVAKAIHYQSPRKARRFVVQNCSAFNDNLLDSELFGHKRGSFTGAVVDKQGLFEVADKGTFFLDEIGDMSPSLQVKVLRVLQEGTYTPVGDTEVRKTDVRVIAATNRDLKRMVECGQFREDLYYRVNVINLVLPPLRERRDDVELLARFFLGQVPAGVTPKRLSDDCLALLQAYAWPGNVRELENEIERILVLAGDDPVISASMLSPRIRSPEAPRAAAVPAVGPQSLPEAIDGLERAMIRASLDRHRGNKTRAAAELGISRRNLIRLVQKYGMATSDED